MAQQNRNRMQQDEAQTQESAQPETKPAAQPPIDIKAIESALKQEQRRKEYNQRPEVKERRKAYQQKQQNQRKAVAAAQKGDKAKLMNELGYSDSEADALIEAVKNIKL